MKIPWNLFHEQSSLPPAWASIIAGVSVLTSLSLSSFLVFEHLSAYKNPEVSSPSSEEFFFICSKLFAGLVFTGAEVSHWCGINGSLLCNRVGGYFSCDTMKNTY